MKHFKGKAIFAILLVAGAIYAYTRYGNDGNLPTFEKIKNFFAEKIQAFGSMEKPNYEIESGGSFSKRYDVVEGDIAYAEIPLPDGFTAQGVQKLELEAAGCAVKIADSEDERFHIEVSGGKKTQYYVEKATLHVVATGGITAGGTFADGMKSTLITIYRPANTFQISVEVSLGAGSIEFGGLYTQYAEFRCGAGKISAENLDADEWKAKVDAGTISVKNAAADKAELEAGMGTIQVERLECGEGAVKCSMGSVELTLAGGEKDHNYTVKAAAGLVKIGEQEFKGVTTEKKITNGAGGTIKIECSAGNVGIDFEH